MQRSAESQVRQRDPESFRTLIEQLTGEASDGNLYVSGETIAQFNQDYAEDEFWGQFAEEIDDARLTGGDVAIPLSRAVAELSGRPDWDAIKGDVRAAPGAMTANEIAAAEAEWETTRREAGETLDAQEREARAAAAPGERLRGSIRDTLMSRGMDPDQAAANAEVTAALFETEAVNLGYDLTGREFDKAVSVQRVLPGLVADPEAADTLDVIVNAMRGGKDAEIGVGSTLMEFIRERGGINDPGGDLASMGMPARLIRDFDPDQGSFGGVSGAGDYGIDSTLRAAIEAGFFPELQGVEAEAGASTLDTQALLDALGRELAGEPVYAETRIDQMRQAGAELRELLSAAGVDPDTASMADIRAAVERFDGGRALEQRGTGPQGQIQFTEGQALIRLFASANASTFQHEMAHFWLERLFANARQSLDTDGNPAARQTFADVEAIKAWFKDNGHPVEGVTIPTEAHEMFARAWEQYLMEGKAPTTRLQSAFRKFSRWLKAIYRTVANLNTPITPEIREVMDRMLATEQEIADAAETRAAYLQFDNAIEAGMSEADARRYAELSEQVRSEAEEQLAGKVMRSIKARDQKQYKSQEKVVRAEVAEAVDARPGFAALKLLRQKDGPRIDKAWLQENFGDDVFGILPAGMPVWKQGGTNPDTLAELTGFSSGDQLVRELLGMEARRRELKEGGDQRPLREVIIAQETKLEMDRRFGDPIAAGTIEREANAAIQNDRLGEKTELELRALGSKTNRQPTPYRMAREWARGRIEQGVIADMISGAAQYRYTRTAAKAARDAQAAILAGDMNAAFRHKQTEMLHTALAREAAEASDQVDVAVRRLLARGRFTKPPFFLMSVENSQFEELVVWSVLGEGLALAMNNVGYDMDPKYLALGSGLGGNGANKVLSLWAASLNLALPESRLLRLEFTQGAQIQNAYFVSSHAEAHIRVAKRGQFHLDGSQHEWDPFASGLPGALDPISVEFADGDTGTDPFDIPEYRGSKITNSRLRSVYGEDGSKVVGLDLDGSNVLKSFHDGYALNFDTLQDSRIDVSKKLDDVTGNPARVDTQIRTENGGNTFGAGIARSDVVAPYPSLDAYTDVETGNSVGTFGMSTIPGAAVALSGMFAGVTAPGTEGVGLYVDWTVPDLSGAVERCIIGLGDSSTSLGGVGTISMALFGGQLLLRSFGDTSGDINYYGTADPAFVSKFKGKRTKMLLVREEGGAAPKLYIDASLVQIGQTTLVGDADWSVPITGDTLMVGYQDSTTANNCPAIYHNAGIFNFAPTYAQASEITRFGLPANLRWGGAYGGTPLGAVGWWDMAKGTGTRVLDSSPNGQHATTLGTVTRFQEQPAPTYRTRAGSPVGAVFPNYIGEELLNTSGNAWFKAYGLGSSDWQAL